MSERIPVPQNVMNGLGLKFIDKIRNRWTIKEDQCVIDYMIRNGMDKGRLIVESPTKDTAYRFDFKKSEKLYRFRIYADDDGFYYDISTDKEWGGEESPEEKRYLDLFMNALKSCTKGLGNKPKSLFYRDDELVPAAPAPNPYGYADPARRAEPDAADALAEAVGKMSLEKKKEGGRKKTRRNKKRRSTRRR